MYYPYLRAKSEELNSLLELDLIANVIPILEPISLETNISKFKRLIAKNVHFVLVINPQAVQLSIEDIIDGFVNGVLNEYDNYSIAYILHNASTQAELQLFHQIPDRNKYLIHRVDFNNLRLLDDVNVNFHVFCESLVTEGYINSIDSLNKIILLDGFDRLQRNADYPLESFFSNLHFTYVHNGFIGIGDYLTQGDNFSVGGGPANAVAIHLTILRNNEVYIRHFISDNREGRGRTAEKFYEALTHLIRFVDENDVLETSAILNYRDLFEREHYPGLAVNKRYSLKNHVEQISSII